MALEDLSDEELDLRLRKGKYRAPRTAGGQKPTLDTMSDEDLDALLAQHASPPPGRREAPPYKLTDYATGKPNMAGPVTDATLSAQAASDPSDSDLTGTSESEPARFERFMNPTPEEAAKGFSDFALGMLLGGPVAGGMGKIIGRGPVRDVISNAVGGGAAGAVQAKAGGGDPTDVMAATAMGAVGGALPQGGRGGARLARAPQTQAEIDARSLAAVGGKQGLTGTSGGMFDRPGYKARPKGSAGTAEMASEAEGVARTRFEQRDASKKAAIKEAKEDVRANFPGRTIDTTPELKEFDRFIADPELGFAGASGPTQPEAVKRMEHYQGNLQHPSRGPNLEFDEINSVSEAANARLRASGKNDYGKAGDEVSAGILAGAKQRFDPREAPGSYAGALERYAAEDNALAKVRDLLYGSETPSDRVSQQQAGAARLARTGTEPTASKNKDPGPALAEQRLDEFVDLESAMAAPRNELRAHNTASRREFGVPYLAPGSALTTNVGRVAQHNLGNAAFRLRPPRIDANGMVAAKPGIGPGNLALPLEIQLMLMQQEEQHGR